MTTDTAKSILDFADSLPGPYGYERSIKICDAGVFGGRFLVTFPALALEMGADLTGLLQRLQCPRSAPVSQLLKRGSILHLGLEQQREKVVCKLYAEDAARIRELWEREPLPSGGEYPVHRSIKWQSGGSAWVETDYDWLPCTTQSELLMRGAECLPEAIPLLSELLARVPSSCPVSHLQLLRVSERGNPRLSLDLNLYDAQLLVSSLCEVSEKLAPKDPFALLLASSLPALEGIAEEVLGHVAVGVGRDGERFSTIYYGACERGGFNGE